MAADANSLPLLQSHSLLCSALILAPLLLIGHPLLSVPCPEKKAWRTRLIRTHVFSWAEDREKNSSHNLDVLGPAWQPPPVFLPGEPQWTEEHGGLQSMVSQWAGRDWATKHIPTGACLSRQRPPRCYCLRWVMHPPKVLALDLGSLGRAKLLRLPWRWGH